MKNNAQKMIMIAGVMMSATLGAFAQTGANANASTGDAANVNADAHANINAANSGIISPTTSATMSPVQSSADPYGLRLAGPVMASGSDAASQNFNQTVLPSLTAFIHSALPEGQNNTASRAFEINPDKIVLSSQSAVRAYFVSEGAGYHNSIGVDATTAGNDPSSWWSEVSSSSSSLIFPDASSTEGGVTDGTSPYGTRTASEPLLPGDFVNLGTFAAGTKLDFFLMANGARQSGSPVFSADESLNPDGFSQHVAAFTPSLFAVPDINSPYIFLSFEDLWGGGDKDINDTIIALDIGVANVRALLATPEPAEWLILGSFLALAVWLKHRMSRPAPAVV